MPAGFVGNQPRIVVKQSGLALGAPGVALRPTAGRVTPDDWATKFRVAADLGTCGISSASLQPGVTPVATWRAVSSVYAAGSTVDRSGIAGGSEIAVDRGDECVEIEGLLEKFVGKAVGSANRGDG